MPRPKVKPQDRQRSIRACDTCKASKKRCDANQPCRLCLKKGTQDSCVYSPTTRDRRRRHSQSTTSRSEVSRAHAAAAASSTITAAAGAAAGGSAVSTAGSAAVVSGLVGTAIPSLSSSSSSSQRPRGAAHCGRVPAVSSSQVPQPQAGGVDEGAESETDFPDSRNSVERTAQQRSVLLHSSSGDKGNEDSPLNSS